MFVPDIESKLLCVGRAKVAWPVGPDCLLLKAREAAPRAQLSLLRLLRSEPFILFFHMLEVGLLFLAGSQKSGKNREAPGKTMVCYLWAFVLLVASVKAEVEFKHHNNTELAAVLQQVHNR